MGDDDLLIHDIRDGTPEEVRSHLLYLIYTPECHYACSIARGKHQLKKAVIGSLSALGSTPTIFRNFGQVTASGAVERDLFLVSDVLATLQRPDHPDDEMLRSVEAFVAMDASGTLDAVVTVEQRDGRCTIVDGNKRAVAFYERRKAGGTDKIVLPIFLIMPT